VLVVATSRKGAVNKGNILQDLMQKNSRLQVGGEDSHSPHNQTTIPKGKKGGL